jgi:dynein heavy chain, axonemal
LPEITTKTYLINFSIKEEGLEAQMLGIIVAKERLTLEEQKNTLTSNISNHRKTILKLENETLR